MKKNGILRKRSVLLAVLVMVLGAAVYLNWHLSHTATTPAPTTDQLTGSVAGQAMYVNAQPTASEDDYFTSVRQQRSKAREEATKQLKEIINNVKSDSNGVAEATKKAGEIALRIETESNIESLVKAKGFADCVAIISDDDVSVVVKTSALLPNDMVQIQEIAKEQTGFSLENIKIIESK